MSFEDDYIDEFDDSMQFDDEALKQIDAAERAIASTSTSRLPLASTSRVPPKKVPTIDDSLLDVNEDDWDDEGIMQEILRVEKAQRSNQQKHFNSSFRQPPPATTNSAKVAGPSIRNAAIPTSSYCRTAGISKARQRNLFGEEVTVPASQGILLVAKKAHTSTATASQRVRDAMNNPNHRFLLGSNERKRKEWDREQPLNVKKSKLTNSFFDDDDDDEDEDELAYGRIEADDEFMSIPGPIQPESIPQMKIQIDREEAKKWVYPTNKEMRDYQFNIVQRALFNNVLVALPTGLGKTFIAAVVILNYYRWFPTGKIIFVAPTKPLVAQQQEACHGICGLPWDCAIEMTGGTKASLRGDEWKTKRIFYMTPQTFENDLCTSAVNAEDVVCLVVDEAHRATGNYAYGKIVRWITARNPFFRVLALTATPGNRPEKVQEVIDNLHINLIEIRTEEAVDIRKYVHKKSEDAVSIPLGGVVSDIIDLLVKLMTPLLELLQKHNLITATKDPSRLAPYSISRLMIEPYAKKILTERRLYPQVKELQQLASAMECLVKYSVQMFYQKLCDISTGSNSNGKKVGTNSLKTKYNNNTVIKEIDRVYLAAQDDKGKVKHPKMEYLLDSVTAHFSNEEEQGRREDTRVMIFCHFRECVLEIVDCLNDVEGIKATLFVGQASSVKGHKGMTQKEQQRIVKAFKEGTFNVMVATSIGEEGLDIGEVDLIINYEAVKNSVRMLQRVGRTGRKRDGRVVILLAEGHEEHSWQHSKDNHKTIQNELINGSHLELFDDVERLVPEDISSEVQLQEVEQPPFEPSMISGPGKKAKKIAKPKRNTDPHRNIPENGLKGFIKVSKLKRKKKKNGKGSSSTREGDSDDSEEEAEDVIPSSDGSSEPEEQAQATIRGKIRKEEAILTDDSQDAELERGILIASSKGTATSKILQSKAGGGAVITTSVSTDATPISQTNSGKRGSRLGVGRALKNISAPQSIASRGSASSQIGADLLLSSSPLEIVSPLQKSDGKNSKHKSTSENSWRRGFEEEDEEPIADLFRSSPVKELKRRARPHPLVAKLLAQRSANGKIEEEEDDEDDEDEEEEEADMQASSQSGSKSDEEKEDQVEEIHHTSFDSPDIPKRKQIGIRRAIRIMSSSPPATSVMMGPPLSVKRGAGMIKSKERILAMKGQTERDFRRKKTIRGSPTSRKLFAYEAERSTDEEVHGEKDENDDGQDTDEADSSDLEHVGNFAPTQAPRGYNQNAIYMQSLMSQNEATPFKRRPKVTSGFQMGIDADQVHRNVIDTPNRRRRRRDEVGEEGSSESGNEDYERDSFVCSDDEDLGHFESQNTSSAL